MANEVKLKLAIEGGQVVGATLDGVSSALDGVDHSAKNATSGAETLRSVLATIATVGTAVALIKMADAVTTLHTSLKLSSNSASEASTAYERLFVIAQQARVSFTELGATYTTIARAGNELGVSQDRLLTVTQAIGNAMTIGGGSAQSMQAALVQLGQGLSSGTLRGEELNSILEQTPRLAKALADGMGVSVGQLRSLGEQGKLTAETVISALEKSAPQLAKEMASSTVTVGQAFTMLTNSATKFVGEADTASGATNNLASALQGIAGAIDSVGNTINNHKEAFGAIANGLAGAAVVAGVAAMAGSIGTVTVAVKALGLAMTANPAILALTLIAAAGAGVASLASDWKKSAEGMRAQMDGINADISLAEERQRTGSEAARARAAVEIQALKDKRDALRQTMAVQDQGSVESASYNAKEMKGFQEKLAAEQSAYAGSKPLDEVRKMAKLRNDILIDANDQAVNIAKAFSKAIANASSPEVAFALEKERNNRLIANAQETTAALKSYDDQKAAPAKEAAKLRLDALIAGYEQEQLVVSAGEQRNLEALANAHALGLESDHSYIAAKLSLQEDANIDQQAVVELELEAVHKSGLALKDRTEQERKYNLELAKLRDQAKGIVQKADEEMAAADMKVFRAAVDQNAQTIEALQAKATNLQDQVKAQRLANAEIGLSAVEVNKLRSATMELAAAEKTLEANRLEKEFGDQARIQALRDQAKAMRELIVVNTDGVQRSTALESFKNAWASVDQTAHSVFTNIVDGGQDAFTKLRDTLKGTLLDLLYQMTVRKWVFEIFANVTGAGASGMTGAILGNSGGQTGMGSLSSASSLYSMGKTGLSTVGDWLGMGGSTAGSGVAVSAASTASTGAVMGGLETGGAAGIGSGTALGGAGASGASMAGFAGIPVVGWIAMGMIASGNAYDQGFRANSKGGEGYTVSDSGPIGPNGMVNQFDHWAQALGIDAKTAAVLSGSSLGAQGMYTLLGGYQVSPNGSSLAGTIGGTGSSLQTRTDYTQDHRGPLGIGSYTTHNSDYSAADSGAVAYVDTAVKVVNASVKQFATTLGLSVDAVDGFTKQIDVSLSGLSATDQKAAIDKAIDGFMNELVTSVYGSSLTALQKPGEASSATLQRLASDFTIVNAGLDRLGLSLLPVSVASAAAAAGLVDAFGGLDPMGASVGAYYDTMYSEGEKVARANETLASAWAKLEPEMAKLGQSVPTSEAEFRALVASIDVTTVSGQNLAASVLALAPAFSQAEAAARTTANNLLSALQNYGTSQEVRDFQVGQIGDALRNAGITVDNATIANGTREQYRAAYESFVAQGNIRAADALMAQQQAFANITKIVDKSPQPSAGNSAGYSLPSSGSASGSSVSSAADRVQSALQQYTDAIFGEVKRIRGLMEGTGQEAYARAQMRFDVTAVQAQAGSEEALKALPELSQNLTLLAEANTSTLLELRMVQAETAATLERTGSIAAQRYGLTVPAFAAGGNHGGGWAMVGERGPELAYLPPARIYNANDTRSIFSGGGGGDTRELAVAFRDFAALLEAIAESTSDAAKSADTTATLLTYAMPDRDAIQTRAIA